MNIKCFKMMLLFTEILINDQIYLNEIEEYND